MRFDQSPYFDDTSSNSNFVDVLFRPSRPLQARELNSIQSLFKNQIERFGNHIFKNGSKVSDARSSIISYKSILFENAQIDSLHEGCLLVGIDSGQEARFIMKVDDKICITFSGSNESGTESKFYQAETVTAHSSDGSQIGSFKIQNTPDFESTLNVFIVESGVFYFNGYFIENKRSILPVDLTQDINIGFQVVEKIITPSDDASLLDNNTNAMSYLNPGADRYCIELVLATKVPDQNTEGAVQNLHEVVNGFITLASISNGTVSYLNQDSAYASLGDMLAQRTYEESGNYTVKPFKLTLKNHKAENALDTTGIDVNGDASNYVAVIGPSKAYVRGYRVETIANTNLISKRARDTLKQGYLKQFEQGAFVKAIPSSNSSVWPNQHGSLLLNDGSVISLYDGPVSGGNLPTGAVIGTATICDAELTGYTSDATPRAIYKYYLSGINMQAGKAVKDVKSLYNATNTFIASAVADSVTGAFVVENLGRQEFIWNVGKSYVKSLRDMDDSAKGSITITLRKKLIGVLDSSGGIVFNSPSGEYFDSLKNNTICILTATGVSSTVTLTSLNTSITPESISINLSASNAGKTITVVLDVINTNLAEKTKTLKSEAVQFNDASLTSYKLDRSDLTTAAIYIFDKTDSSNKDLWVDVTDCFNIFNGQSDTTYRNATITKTEEYPLTIVPAIHGIRVEYQYFHHTGNQGFFTVDSYSSIDYGDIPTYKTASGTSYRLADCFDFRPLVINDVVQSSASLPSIGNVSLFDVENYLGRVDTVVIQKDGGITIMHGDSSETPVPYEVKDSVLPIYELWLSPYTFTLNDIRVKYLDNRSYTMQDIRGIDSRLEAVEYYTALSLLEKSAKDMSIKDVNGLDRFKNGFVVDDFRNFQVGDTSSNEFRASHDISMRELRPSYTDRSRKMKLDTSASYGYYLVDGMAYLPWQNVIADSQPLATKSLSVNPYYMTSKKGKIVLSPNFDNWCDTTREPDLQVNIDTGTTEALTNLANYTGQGVTYGEWSERNRTLSKSSEGVTTTSTKSSTSVNTGTLVKATTSSGGILFTDTTVTDTTTATTTVIDTFDVTQQRTAKGTEISGRTTNYSAGDRVTDVSLNPYMRSIDVTFSATGMLEDTKVWAYFDGVAVSANTRPLDGEFGDQLVTNSKGEVTGIFRIPEGRFFVGEKMFKLTGDINNEGDVDTEFTKASATFFAGGISVTKEKLALNVVTPELNVLDTVQSRTVQVDVPVVTTNVTSKSTTTRALTETPPVSRLTITARDASRTTRTGELAGSTVFTFQGNEYTVSGLKSGDSITSLKLASRGAIGGCGAGSFPIVPSNVVVANPGNYTEVVYKNGTMRVRAPIVWTPPRTDPVAQSFTVPVDCFITGMDVYFERVDAQSKSLFVQIRTMDNGYPTEQILAEKIIDPADAAKYVSADSLTAYHVDFKFPTFVKSTDEYCFVIGGDTPNTRVWVARLGDTLINDPATTVETPPTLGSSFRSQNGSTWNAEQYEDIKYNLYCAEFLSNEMGLSFVVDHEAEELGLDPFECETGVQTIRVYMKDHGLKDGDKIRLNMFTRETYRVVSPSASKPRFGQRITTASGSGIIDDVVSVSSTVFDLKIKELSGSIVSGEAFKCDSAVLFGETADEFSGTIQTAPANIINGVDLKELNTTLQVKSVDSNGTFLVDVLSVPTQSGRFGGTGTVVEANYRYEIHNSSCEYNSYGADETWRFKGIDSNNASLASKDIMMGVDYHLDNSNKILSKLNEDELGINSIDLNCTFKTSGSYVTPVINTTTMSTIFVSNSVGNASATTIDVKPNAVGRYKPETDPSQGTSEYKYVTREVTLAKPATDLRVVFDAYKDISADFDVYVKTKVQFDTTNLDDYEWMLFNIGDKTNSSNLADRVEYTLNASEMVGAWPSDFISFKLKIVGKTSNPAKPPMFQSLRVVAFT